MAQKKKTQKTQILGSKSIKHTQNFCAENYKTLIKEIKEDK